MFKYRFMQWLRTRLPMRKYKFTISLRHVSNNKELAIYTVVQEGRTAKEAKAKVCHEILADLKFTTLSEQRIKGK